MILWFVCQKFFLLISIKLVWVTLKPKCESGEKLKQFWTFLFVWLVWICCYLTFTQTSCTQTFSAFLQEIQSKIQHRSWIGLNELSGGILVVCCFDLKPKGLWDEALVFWQQINVRSFINPGGLSFAHSLSKVLSLVISSISLLPFHQTDPEWCWSLETTRSVARRALIRSVTRTPRGPEESASSNQIKAPTESDSNMQVRTSVWEEGSEEWQQSEWI